MQLETCMELVLYKRRTWLRSKLMLFATFVVKLIDGFIIVIFCYQGCVPVPDERLIRRGRINQLHDKTNTTEVSRGCHTVEETRTGDEEVEIDHKQTMKQMSFFVAKKKKGRIEG